MKLKCNMDMINSILLLVILFGFLYYYQNSNEKFTDNTCFFNNENEHKCEGVTNFEDLQNLLQDTKKDFNEKNMEEIMKKYQEINQITKKDAEKTIKIDNKIEELEKNLKNYVYVTMINKKNINDINFNLKAAHDKQHREASFDHTHGEVASKNMGFLPTIASSILKPTTMSGGNARGELLDLDVSDFRNIYPKIDIPFSSPTPASLDNLPARMTRPSL